MKIKYITKQSGIYLLLVFFVLICLFLNSFGIADLDVNIESLVVIGGLSVLSIAFIGGVTSDKFERIILLVGYIARLVYLYLDVSKGLTLASTDAIGFWTNALDRYHGVAVREYTKYPYLLNVWLHVFGENKLLVQYVNIWVWLLAVLVLYRCLHLLEIGKKARRIGVICFCFLPEYILLSASLLRESMIIFLNVVSLYYFLRWFKKQKFLDIVLAEVFILFSMVLHSGAIGIGAAYGISYALYNKRNKRVCISIKTFVIAMVGVLGIFIIFVSPYRGAALSYLPKLNNMFELQSRGFYIGGSDYLRSMPYTENPFVFAGYTLLRMIYFYASPVPWEWRGVVDMLAFIVDTLFHITILVIGIYCWKKNRKNRGLIGFLLLCVLMTGLVFAWGVSNAGTAMRHRGKMIGIESILLAIFMERKRLTIGKSRDKTLDRMIMGE